MQHCPATIATDSFQAVLQFNANLSRVYFHAPRKKCPNKLDFKIGKLSNVVSLDFEVKLEHD